MISRVHSISKEPIPHPPAAPDADGQIVLHRQQSDTLVRAGLATEEIHKYPLVSRILVRDKSQCCPLMHDLFDLLGRTLLVDIFCPLR
jgi:hypothetical protein